MRYWLLLVYNIFLCFLLYFIIYVFVFGIQLFVPLRRNIKLTKFMLLRRGVRYWLLLVYNVFFMLFNLFYNLCFCIPDTIILVIKTKYKINKI